jgi:hypothetical protein
MVRQGDHLRTAVDVVALDSTTLTVRLFTKREPAAGDGFEVSVSRTITANAVGRRMQEWNPSTGAGLGSFVRYLFVATKAPNSPLAPYVVFRMLSPVWFDTVPTAAISNLPSTGTPS